MTPTQLTDKTQAKLPKHVYSLTSAGEKQVLKDQSAVGWFLVRHDFILC